MDSDSAFVATRAKWVEIADGNRSWTTGGDPALVREVIEMADIALAIWEDPTQPAGLGDMIVRGAEPSPPPPPLH